MTAEPHVNFRRIAEKAGVSHATVSRALRNAANVSEATKTKVREAAEALGYRPDPLVAAYASRMRRGRNAESGGVTLAWLSSDPPGREWRWLAPYKRGVEERSRELGYHLDETIHTAGMSGDRVRGILEARGIRGVIVPNLHYFGAELPEMPRVVTVGIGPTMSARPQHQVSLDAFVNVGIAFSQLLSRGYRRIGFCEHHMGTFRTQAQALGGFLVHQRRVLVEDRIPPLVGVRPGDDEADCRRRVMAWIREARPDAVITGFYHVRNWLEEAGLDTGLAHYALADETAGWSGVDPRPEQMGAAAVDLLTAHILRNEYGTPKQPKLMRFAGRWVEGATTRSGEAGGSGREPLPGLPDSLDWFDREILGEDPAG